MIPEVFADALQLQEKVIQYAALDHYCFMRRCNYGENPKSDICDNHLKAPEKSI